MPSSRERNQRKGVKSATARSASEKRKPSGSPTDSVPPKTPKTPKPLVQSTMPDVFNFTSTPKESTHDEDQPGDTNPPSSDQESPNQSHNISYPSTLFNFIDNVSIDVLTDKLAAALMLPKLQQKFHETFYEIAKEVIYNFTCSMIEPMQDQMTKLREELKTTREELHEKTDELEQYSRRNSLRISGIDEKEGEDIEKVTLDTLKKLNKEIYLSDLDRCHRVGKRVPGRKRQIIVKFLSYHDRNKVYSNRRKLRDSMESVYINEDLTQHRSTLFKMARDLKRSRWIENTWTKDGRVFVLEQPEGAIRVVNSKQDLNKYVRA